MRRSPKYRTEGSCGEALFQDMDAVVAAMVMPYSQGQTEGRVNKLKLIKSSMYGRGIFDLLRQRVMYAEAA